MTIPELRQAARLVRRQPAFAAGVVAVIALAVGATTAIFTIVNGVAPPAAAADRPRWADHVLDRQAGHGSAPAFDPRSPRFRAVRTVARGHRVVLWLERERDGRRRRRALDRHARVRQLLRADGSAGRARTRDSAGGRAGHGRRPQRRTVEAALWRVGQRRGAVDRPQRGRVHDRRRPAARLSGRSSGMSTSSCRTRRRPTSGVRIVRRGSFA